MTVCIAVVYEATADFRTATELADRVFLEAIEWLEEDLLPNVREWIGQAETILLTWTNIKELARSAGIRVHGHFDGRPGEPDAAAARRAIHYLRRTVPGLQAIVLIRDEDRHPERRAGLEQARTEDHGGLTIVVGVAVVERECWVMSGFDPLNDDEQVRFQAVCQSLGFDPRLNSHRLPTDKSARSPKKVLAVLTESDQDRERDCWRSSRLDVLRERGNDNGLALYLEEIHKRLAPLIGHVSAKE